VKADDVLIIDQIGLLRSCYAVSDAVFVGKSFTVGGGQNMIEPALYKKPVVVGPRTENFKDVMRQFLDSSAIVQVADTTQLVRALEKILADRSYAEGLGVMAYQVLQDNLGATQRTFGLIQKEIAA
jgi:3-deoxy-D-manno-octulosonic-acid transferase